MRYCTKRKASVTSCRAQHLPVTPCEATSDERQVDRIFEILPKPAKPSRFLEGREYDLSPTPGFRGMYLTSALQGDWLYKDITAAVLTFAMHDLDGFALVGVALFVEALLTESAVPTAPCSWRVEFALRHCSGTLFARRSQSDRRERCAAVGAIGTQIASALDIFDLQ